MHSSKPSVPELRRVCQPVELVGRRSAEHWAGRAYGRHLSIYLTWAGVRIGISANATTLLMILVGVGGAAAFSRPGIRWAIAGAVLVQLYLLLDCADGEIARWTETTSATGIYLDRLGHYVVEAALFVALGLRAGNITNVAARGPVAPLVFLDPSEGLRWAVWGLVAALLHVLGKAETDLVEVARAKHGLPPAADEASVAAPRARGLAALRRAAGALPVNRLTGAVELSFVVLLAAVADEARGGLDVTRGLTVAMAGIAAYVLLGHLVMILASSRLRA